jgi:hypothetical protein
LGDYLKYLRSKIVLVLLFTICTLTNAQSQKVNISGWVTDAVTGDFLIGSNILLYKDSLSLNSQPLKGAATNNVGFYVLSNIPKGKYAIVIRNIGYKTLAAEINNTIDQGSLRYNAKLTPEDVKLEEIIIKDKKVEESKISTIEVSTELLDQLPSLTGETPIFKALEMMPGVKTAIELSSGLYVRGGSPDQTLTLLDGVIIYNPAHLGNFSSTFNSKALQSVKLIKGAFPAEYGGRLSSVLDIKLRSGTQEKDKRNLSIGSISSSLMLEGPISENLTYMLSGRSMYYDIYQKSFNKNSTSPYYNYHDLSAKINFNISESSILSISGIYNNDNLSNPKNSPDINYDIAWKNSSLSFNWLKINSKSLLVNVLFSYVNYQFRSLISSDSTAFRKSDYFSNSKLNDYLIKVTAESNFRASHKIKAGFELVTHDFNLLYSDFYNDLIEIDPNIATDILANEITFFVQDDWQILPFWKANIGSRFYYFLTNEYFNLEPRVSTVFYLSDNIQINAAYSIAHQFLHLITRSDISLPTDLWYPSKGDVEPSRAQQFVFGIDTYWLNKSYKFSLEAYYKGMKNLYELKNGSSFQLRENISDQFTKGEGEAYGLELFLNKRAGSLTGWIGYTLSWTKRKFADLNAGRIFYPRYDRRHDISIVLTYKLNDKINIGATWTYATGQGFTLPNGQYSFSNNIIDPNETLQYNYTERNGYRLKSYHKLDLSASYNFNWGTAPVEFYVSLFNVYNRANPFSLYLDYESDNGKDSEKIVLKQLTLFPFIPTIGFNIKF